MPVMGPPPPPPPPPAYPGAPILVTERIAAAAKARKMTVGQYMSAHWASYFRMGK